MMLRTTNQGALRHPPMSARICLLLSLAALLAGCGAPEAEFRRYETFAHKVSEAAEVSFTRLFATRKKSGVFMTRPMPDSKRSSSLPLRVRCTVLLRSGVEHVVLLTMHHVVSDAWSLGVLIRELSALYAAFVGNLYAPTANILVGGYGQIYGSLFGKNISAAGFLSVGYDAAIQTGGKDCPPAAGEVPRIR